MESHFEVSPDLFEVDLSGLVGWQGVGSSGRRHSRGTDGSGGVFTVCSSGLTLFIVVLVGRFLSGLG